MPDWNRVTIHPCAAAKLPDPVVVQLAHVCFHVADLDRSLAFYRDVLALRPAFEFHDENGKRFGIYLHIGGRSFLELFLGSVDAIKAHGVKIERDIQTGKDGTQQAWIKDPDGNSIELFEYTAQSAQRPWLG
ncbi:MAG: VOC family protein [Spirochaetes bacterium]|nr:VOC family protein [Spirochaetota bacterium]